MFDVVIVGSGLSGMTCASILAESKLAPSMLVLEGLDRIGGRTFCADEEGMDLGAAWSWPFNDKKLGALIDKYELEKLPQNVKGQSLFDAEKVVNGGKDSSPSGPGSIRLEKGMGEICHAIMRKNKLEVKLDSLVEKVENREDHVRIQVKGGDEYLAKRVVIAAPPSSVVNGIEFDPPMDKKRQQVFSATPTWMASAGKICLTFDKQFWLDQGLNGTFQSYKGPISQGWDNSNKKTAALCGFVFGKQRKHLESKKAFLESPILAQLERIFGSKVRNYNNVYLKSWEELENLECTQELDFGHPLLSKSMWENKLFFASTESTRFESGHMEGAVLSGEKTAHQILESF